MTDKSLFTIIVAVFNAEATLQQCIDSFVSQTYENKELIIIDGGSTDRTLEIINENESEISYWLSEPDTGIYNAWNKALLKAQGEWIYFLGADDFFINNDVLNNVANYFKKISSTFKVVYGQVSYISPAGTYLYSQGEPWNLVGKRYKQLMTIPHQGVFHKKSLFEQYGNFDENFKIAGDYEFLLRELKDNDAFFIPYPISVMRQGGISNNNSNSILIIKELRRAQRKNGLKWPGLYWYLAMVRVHIRIFLWWLLGESIARKILDYGRCLMKKPPHWEKNT